MTERTEPDTLGWLKPGDAATLLGVTTKTVARWADEGRIRSMRPGAHRRYSEADIEALLSRAHDWAPSS